MSASTHRSPAASASRLTLTDGRTLSALRYGDARAGRHVPARGGAERAHLGHDDPRARPAGARDRPAGSRRLLLAPRRRLHGSPARAGCRDRNRGVDLRSAAAGRSVARRSHRGRGRGIPPRSRPRTRHHRHHPRRRPERRPDADPRVLRGPDRLGDPRRDGRPRAGLRSRRHAPGGRARRLPQLADAARRTLRMEAPLRAPRRRDVRLPRTGRRRGGPAGCASRAVLSAERLGRPRGGDRAGHRSSAGTAATSPTRTPPSSANACPRHPSTSSRRATMCRRRSPSISARACARSRGRVNACVAFRVPGAWPPSGVL